MAAGLAPLCEGCSRYLGIRPGIGHACDAFGAESIPVAILASAHDHHTPYPGDGGMTYEPRATMDPAAAARADDVEAEIVQAAGILFLTPDGEILLVRRTAGAGDHIGEWSIPGGKIEAGESAEEAARREAKEEVGWEAADATLTEWTRQRRGNVDFTTFLCKLEARFEAVVDGVENDEQMWAKRDELVPLVTAPKAEPAPAVVGDEKIDRRLAALKARRTGREDSADADDPRPVVTIAPDGTVSVYRAA